MAKTPGPPMTEGMFTRVLTESIQQNIPMEEVCRRALENYFFVKEQVRRGNKVVIVDKDGKEIKEIIYQL